MIKTKLPTDVFSGNLCAKGILDETGSCFEYCLKTVVCEVTDRMFPKYAYFRRAGIAMYLGIMTIDSLGSKFIQTFMDSDIDHSLTIRSHAENVVSCTDFDA